MSTSQDKLQRLAEMVAGTRPDELLCDAAMDQVCSYFEAVQRGAALTPEQQAVADHLAACPECLETYKALCMAIEDEPDEG